MTSFADSEVIEKQLLASLWSPAFLEATAASTSFLLLLGWSLLVSLFAFRGRRWRRHDLEEAVEATLSRRVSWRFQLLYAVPYTILAKTANSLCQPHGMRATSTLTQIANENSIHTWSLSLRPWTWLDLPHQVLSTSTERMQTGSHMGSPLAFRCCNDALETHLSNWPITSS